jgi:hypothetical protein
MYNIQALRVSGAFTLAIRVIRNLDHFQKYDICDRTCGIWIIKSGFQFLLRTCLPINFNLTNYYFLQTK